MIQFKILVTEENIELCNELVKKPCELRDTIIYNLSLDMPKGLTSERIARLFKILTDLEVSISSEVKMIFYHLIRMLILWEKINE
jgi:hypothetical protein